MWCGHGGGLVGDATATWVDGCTAYVMSLYLFRVYFHIHIHIHTHIHAPRGRGQRRDFANGAQIYHARRDGVCTCHLGPGTGHEAEKNAAGGCGLGGGWGLQGSTVKPYASTCTTPMAVESVVQQGQGGDPLPPLPPRRACAHSDTQRARPSCLPPAQSPCRPLIPMFACLAAAKRSL